MAVPYQPLADYLTAQPPATTAVTLTLAEVAQIVGQPLPAGASARGWWSNQLASAQARAWLAVGWRTQWQPRQLPMQIVFVRALHPAPSRYPASDERDSGGRSC